MIIICWPRIGNVHLKIRLHKRGLSLKKDCAMNMRDLHHEYEEGCILRETFGAKLLGVDLAHLYMFPLFETDMGSRH